MGGMRRRARGCAGQTPQPGPAGAWDAPEAGMCVARCGAEAGVVPQHVAPAQCAAGAHRRGGHAQTKTAGLWRGAGCAAHEPRCVPEHVRACTLLRVCLHLSRGARAPAPGRLRCVPGCMHWHGRLVLGSTSCRLFGSMPVHRATRGAEHRSRPTGPMCVGQPVSTWLHDAHIHLPPQQHRMSTNNAKI